MRETWIRSLGWEDPLEKEMATHSSTLAWKIPWTEEPGRLQSMGLLRVGHNWATWLSLFTFMHWRRSPLQCSCLENPRDSGLWWAAIYGVTQSRTQQQQHGWSRYIYISPLEWTGWISLQSKGGVICISAVIDISPGNLDSSLHFFQPSVCHDVLCIEVK